jgi:hypothetical protein
MKTLLTPLVAAALALASGYSSAQTVVGGCKIEPKASCPKAVMRQARLANMDLSGADLSRANLQLVQAAGIRFVNANLQGTDFHSADLSGADFSNANLRGAVLVGARIDGAKWAGTDLSGAQWPAGRDDYGAPLGRICAEGSIGNCR